MHSPRTTRPRLGKLGTHQACGFSLIELMIAVAILSVLAAVALPSFNDAMRKSRRTEAVSALNRVQQAQERWRANNAQYANNTQLTLPLTPANAGDPVGLGLSSTSSDGRYTLTIDSADATSHSVTATAVSTSSQANDGACVRLRVVMSNGNLVYSSAPATGTTFDSSASNPCWNKS